MTSLICNACQIQIHSDEERATHYKAEWHRYNVKRRCAGLASIPQALFDSQLAALNSKKAAESAQKATLLCKPCKKTFTTTSAYQAHIASKKHLKKAEKQGEDEEGEEEEEDEAVAAPGGVKTATAAAVAKPAVTASSVSSASTKVKAESKHNDEEDDDAMEDGEESNEEGEAIPLLHCLFCPKEFTSVSSSVDHMLKQHGFFIPFVENLVDLDGLLTYLGEKVGIGHVCLWCNGKGRARYPSTSAVQKHMKAKSHCKLRLEEEEDEEELLDYYDFDLAEEDEEEEEEEATKKAGEKSAASSDSAASTAMIAVSAVKDEPIRRAGGGGASSINDAGELVLADGSIVGSRALKHLYKQHVRPSKDLDDIARNYKRLALTTDVRENPRIYRRKREAFHLRARKREDLAKGLCGNFQFHFRAQVSY